MFEKYKSFTLEKQNCLAIAELNLISDPVDVLKNIENIDTSKTWYWFSRIIVPSAIGNQGIGSLLLNRMKKWALLNQYSIVCGVSPYGNLDYNKLIVFYGRFGFTKTNIKDILVFNNS